MTHTPGPWELRPVEWGVTGMRGESFEVWAGDLRLSRTGHEANARLIAAAPALLEALEALLIEYMGRVGSAYEESAGFRTEVEKIRPNAFKARDQARDAIALAKGETVTA